MSQTTSHTDPAFPPFPHGYMVTLSVTLQSVPGASPVELSLLLPDTEWRKLVADFAAMPADERQRVGLNIRQAVAKNPFPANGQPISTAQHKACDAFMNDCVLLAALAEATGKPVLADTAVDRYTLLHGNPIRAKLN